jgi:hypothetical protein
MLYNDSKQLMRERFAKEELGRAMRYNPVFAFVVLFVALMVSGCVSPISIGLDDVKEEYLNKEVFSDKTLDLKGRDDVKKLRSGYILAAFALYGVHAVKRYSGEDQADDALMIRNRLKMTISFLQERIKDDVDNPEFEYRDYVFNIFRFVKVTTYPTKRYYREHLWQAILSQNAIAIAKDLRDALKGLAEVSWYQGAIKIDATNVLKIINNKTPPSVAVGDWNGVNGLLKKACTRLTYLAEGDPSTLCASDDFKIKFN